MHTSKDWMHDERLPNRTEMEMGGKRGWATNQKYKCHRKRVAANGRISFPIRNGHTQTRQTRTDGLREQTEDGVNGQIPRRHTTITHRNVHRIPPPHRPQKKQKNKKQKQTKINIKLRQTRNGTLSPHLSVSLQSTPSKHWNNGTI